jgi:hypothetical protein
MVWASAVMKRRREDKERGRVGVRERAASVHCNRSNKAFKMLGLIEEFSPTLNQDDRKVLCDYELQITET